MILYHLKFCLVKYFIYFNDDTHKLYQVINLRDRREYKKYLVEVEKVKGKKKKRKKGKKEEEKQFRSQF